MQIKFTYKQLVKKSSLKNNFIENKKKTYLLLYQQQNLATYKKKNVCLLSGENTSIRKKTLTSRFSLNYLSIGNKLQNFQVNSW